MLLVNVVDELGIDSIVNVDVLLFNEVSGLVNSVDCVVDTIPVVVSIIGTAENVYIMGFFNSIRPL